MDTPDSPRCPDCDDPLTFAYTDTSGQGAHKRGDRFNTIADTLHFLCFPCEKAWKQRLNGPMTPDIVGDLAFFVCRQAECGERLHVIEVSNQSGAIELACSRRHRHVVRGAPLGELTLAELA